MTTITKQRSETHTRKNRIFLPKNERKKFTENDVYAMLLIATLIFNAIVFLTLQSMKNGLYENEQSSREDMCRIKYMFVDNDNVQTYICTSQTTNKQYLIKYGESQKIDENPYIYRPVIIYKNGTVK